MTFSGRQVTKHFWKSCDKCLNGFDLVAHAQILSVTSETLQYLREGIWHTGLADINRTSKRIIHFWTNSLNIFMIKGRGDTLLFLGELSPGCLTMLIDLTSPDHSKFKFKIINAKAISDKEMRFSLCRKRFTYFSSSWKRSTGAI